MKWPWRHWSTGVSAGGGDDRVELLRLELEALAKLSNRARLDVADYPELSAIVGAKGSEEWAAGVGELSDGLEEPFRSAALCFFENTNDRWFTTYEARSTAAAQELGTTFHTFRTRDPKTGLSRRDLFFGQVAGAVTEASRPSRWTLRHRAVALVAMLAVMAVLLGGSSVSPLAAPFVLGRQIEGCDIPVGTSVSTRSARSDLVPLISDYFEAEGGMAALGCPEHAAEEWQQLWVQKFSGGTEQPPGFLLADLERDTVVWAEAEIVDEYQQTIKGDLQNEGGLPLESSILAGRHVLRLSEGGLIIAHQPGGPAFWIPGPAVEYWLARGGPDGEFGLPMTDPRFEAGVPHQDYERGYLREGKPLQAEGHLITDDLSVYLDSLDRPTDQGILRSIDETAWWINAGTRHWIPDGDTWFCLGGDDNVIDFEAPGWVIGSFPAGPNATCP